MTGLPPGLHTWMTILAAAGLIGGLLLFVRGLAAYRSGAAVSAISTSTVASAAAGEIRVSGVVRPAAITLVSPVQSKRCVYYRALVTEEIGDRRTVILREERGVGFLVEDPSGSIRVFPAGARWELPEGFGGRTDIFGDDPPGLALNDGPSSVVTETDREAAIRDLLTVHAPQPDPALIASGSGATIGLVPPRRIYHESVLEPGATVTVVGTAVPFGELPDPAASDQSEGPLAALDDPEIAADLARATASGSLAGTPDEAWGNAAIPGFGIGRPVRTPVLDPGARPEPVADTAAAERAEEAFEIPADALVLAGRPDAPLSIFEGTPVEVENRAQSRFLLGMVGAVLAIVSAVMLALLVTGL